MKFAVGAPVGGYATTAAPLKPAPFITVGADALVGQWGMIPPSSPMRKPTLPNGRPMSTNNARRERVNVAPTYRRAWQAGRRCLIPADSFDEPYWGTGKNIWWRFWRADSEPWALAGIWDDWTDSSTGEVVPNFSMLTQNCDGHPLLSLMHKPDPTKGPQAQDKRAVVPVEKTQPNRCFYRTGFSRLRKCCLNQGSDNGTYLTPVFLFQTRDFWAIEILYLLTY